jgi:acetyl-CoA C-acetyltransferase
MPLDPRTPVIVGVGQLTHRPGRDDPTSWTDPVTLMARALEMAGEDAASHGRSSLLDRLDLLIAVPSFVWSVPDPARVVADVAGVQVASTRRTFPGGTVPQAALLDAAAGIAKGAFDVAAVIGAEAIRSRDLARKAGATLTWATAPPDAVAAEELYEVPDALLDPERAAGLSLPAHAYALLEQARRRTTGLDRTAHLARLDAIAARMREVARSNELAWLRDAEDVPASVPTATNRPISLPYTKLLTSNVVVDMGAAVIVSSLEAARRAGVPDERLVFPVAGAKAREQWFLSERDELSRSCAMSACVASLFGEGSVNSIDDVSLFDLYSCFPIAVQLAGDALGIDVATDPRPPTVTGGMTFFGGPGNNYVAHSIAEMALRLRREPEALGLVTGLGWYASTHLWALYSATPPGSGFGLADVQPDVDAVALRTVDDAYEGSGTLESYTVGYERDGSAERWIASIRTPKGARRILGGTDASLAAQLEASDPLGDDVVVTGDRIRLR